MCISIQIHVLLINHFQLHFNHGPHEGIELAGGPKFFFEHVDFQLQPC